jgi:hypothetical protein
MSFCSEEQNIPAPKPPTGVFCFERRIQTESAMSLIGAKRQILQRRRISAFGARAEVAGAFRDREETLARGKLADYDTRTPQLHRSRRNEPEKLPGMGTTPMTKRNHDLFRDVLDELCVTPIYTSACARSGCCVAEISLQRAVIAAAVPLKLIKRSVNRV